MATAAKVVYSHITKQPGVRGGKACIDDTRISVADVVVMLKQGLDDRQIIQRYPALNLAQVHAAISYYYENSAEVEANLAEDGGAEDEHERRMAAPPRSRELAWCRAHESELRALAGRWVVVEGEELIANGPDPGALVAQARARGIRVPYVFFVEPSDEKSVKLGL